MIVTMHAAERYCERVNPALTVSQARSAIAAHTRAIECAIAFGAHVVRIGTGQKLVIEGDTVVTVAPRDFFPKRATPAFPRVENVL
jgi:hypothetical protein